MTSGYFYKHDYAPDIYIQVLKVFQIKAEETLVKCRVFGTPLHQYFETTDFRLKRENRRHWQVFAPRQRKL